MEHTATKCAACDGTGKRGRGKCRVCGSTGHGKRGQDYQATGTHDTEGRRLLNAYIDKTSISNSELAAKITAVRKAAGRGPFDRIRLDKYLHGWYRPRLELSIDIAKATGDAVPVTSWATK